MLPIETKLSLPTEIPSSQNIEFLDGNQTQMFLLSSNSNKPITSKQHRRRKMSKLNDSAHVNMNSHMARSSPVDVTFANHHISSTLMHEYGTSADSAYVINNKMIPVGHYVQPGQYRVDSNGNLSQILPFSFSLTSAGSNMSASSFDEMSRSHAPAKMHLLKFNPLLNNLANERPLSAVSSQDNEYENLIQPCPIVDDMWSLTHSYSLPSSSSPSITTSAVPPTKPKRKYTRRARRSPIDQQSAQYSNVSSDQRISNCASSSSLPLPSMTVALAKPQEHHLPVDMSRTSNFESLSQSDSRTSSKPPSTSTDSQSTLITDQQHLLPHSTTNIHELQRRLTQRLANRQFRLMQNTMNNSSRNNLSYNFPDFLAMPHEHYFMVPSNPMFINIPSMTYSSLLPESFAPISSLPFSGTMEKMRKKRRAPRKSKVVPVLMEEENVVPKPLRTETSVTRKRLQKRSKVEDNRTKSLIRRMKHINKLAVLKFMIKKRKQEQQAMNNKLLEVKVENVIPDVSRPVKTETNLTDIITSNLKITFDSAQNIASISLFYHQRRKTENYIGDSSVGSSNADNKLGLLVEALEYLETYNGSPKLALESIK